MNKAIKNVPYMKSMKPLSDKIITLSPNPNRTERRKRQTPKLRNGFTRQHTLIKKIKRIEQTKNKTSITNRIVRAIKTYSLTFAR
jgi:hypothetical protein